ACVGRAQVDPLTPERAAAVGQELSAPTGLTERRSNFDRRDVLQALCDRLPGGATVVSVEQLGEDYLARPEVVALGEAQASLRRGDGRVVSLDLGGLRCSTTELLAIEGALLDAAQRRRGERCAVV